MRLSIIIPVHNGGDDLRHCLESLSANRRAPDEIVVVDDASTDSSAAVARSSGARVLSYTGSPRGPAFARNRGAEVAAGEVLVFLDADVAAHPDTLARIERYFEEQPGLTALFGSYDDTPPTSGMISRYKNLAHHYVHQHSSREASTFWAGCGAIRREVFAAQNGFDESYENASIEDIELGTRLVRSGHRIWLCPEIQVTHLKQWTFFGLLRSDIFDRAVPWTRLILRQGRLPNALNLNWRSRVCALLACVALVGLGLGFEFSLAWTVSLVSLGLLFFLDRDFYTFANRRGGAAFAACAAAMRILYFFYSSIVFAALWFAHGIKTQGVRVQKAAWHVKPRHALWLLLLATLVKGIMWSVIIPPWHAPDENTHFWYAQMVERFGELHPTPNTWYATELGASWIISQIHPVRFDPSLILNLTDRDAIQRQLDRLDDPSIKRDYVNDDGPSYNSFYRFTFQHPPLYYVIAGAPQAIFEDRSIFVRVLADRWLSVLFGLITTALAFRAGQMIWQNDAWALLLATLVSFQPMITFVMAIVNNQGLEVALFSACLVLSLIILRHGLSLTRALMLGILLGLSLLSRTSLFSLLIPIGTLLVYDLIRQQRRKQGALTHAAHWAAVFVIAFLMAGWWYLSWSDAHYYPLGGSVFSAEDAAGAVSPTSLLPYLLSYDWGNVYSNILKMYWGNFGWLDTPMPDPLLIGLSWISVVAGAMMLGWLIRRGLKALAAEPRRRSVLFLAISSLSIVAFYTTFDYLLLGDPTYHYGFQGRYFLAPIIAQMGCLSVGLIWLAPERLRRLWMWLLAAGMIVLNIFAIFSVIPLRYYGARNPLLVADRASVLQPVDSSTILFLYAVFLILTIAYLYSLWQSFKNSSVAV